MEQMTKEEKQGLLEKQFLTVLEKELDVYDTQKKVHTDLHKELQSIETELKKNYKSIDAEGKKVVTAYKAKAKERETAHQTVLEQIKKTREEAVVLHAKQQTDIDALDQETEAANKKVLADAKKVILADKKTAEKEQKAGVEAAEKAILQIKEKGQKDQTTFDQKLAELKSKYEAKIETLDEKEETKMAKLTEAHEKKVASVKESIQKELDKHQKNLGIVVPTFEEELEEIDEKIVLDKAEFDKKFANIKASSNKRIAVREKHMQRAIEENDNRSAKQHKKDIAKFRKETEKDLQLLEKNFAQQKQESADYRINFIKEHYANLASLEKAFVDIREQKVYEIDQLKIEHTNQLDLTAQEYNQLRADELKLYNETYAQTREKQESIKHQERIDLEEQEMLKINIDLTLAAQLDILEERTKAAQEAFDHAERLRKHDLETKHGKNDNDLAIEQAKLDAQIDVAELEKERDLNILVNEENKEHHALQDKRHTAQKEAINAHQLQYKPAVLSRFETIQAFQKEDVLKHISIQQKVLETEAIELEKEHTALLKDIDARLEAERTFFEGHIEELAGPQEEALQAFITEQETALETLQNQIEQLTDRKDRKERNDLEEQHRLAESKYKTERANMEHNLERVVGVYKDALNDLIHRHDVAVQDVNDLYNHNKQLIEQELQRIEEAKASALSRLEQQHQQTAEKLNTFELQIASRQQQHTESNQTYLDRQLQMEDGHITSLQNECEAAREARNTVLDQTIAGFNDENNTLKSDNETYHQAQNQAFEAYQEQSNQTIVAREQQLSADQQNEKQQFESKKQGILSELDQVIATIKGNLDEQHNQYNQTVAAINEAKNNAAKHLEDEHKRIKHDKDNRVQEAYKTIEEEQQQNIQSYQ
jgi:hypothetical protein